VGNLSDGELEEKIISLSRQIRAKLDKLVDVAPTATRPGRLNTQIASEAMELEKEQCKLISELLRRYREKNLDNLS